MPGPGEVGVLRTNRLGVVVRKQSSVLVASESGFLEPRGEGSVQLCPPRLGDALVDHLARERVLDRVLALAGKRGAGATADEVALGEQLEVGHTADELVDRARPEDASDDGSHLQGRLLRGRQQVDARSQDRLHRVGNLETFG